MSVSVRLLLFGQARELAGFSEKEIDVPCKTTKDELMRIIFDQEVSEIANLMGSCLLAINHEYVDTDETIEITSHSEIAVIPPISGG